MKVTNNLGLPLPIVKAIENDPYDNGGTKSVTTLLKPPQYHAIIGKHGEEMTEDAADRIWALVGQVGHTILERAAGGLDPASWLSERRFYGEIDGEAVSAAADLIHIGGGVVYDFKFTSGWAVVGAREGKSEWRNQLSVLAYLARRGLFMVKELPAPADPLDMDTIYPIVGMSPDGKWYVLQGEPHDIQRGKIVAIVRDWTKLNAKRFRDWPEKQVEVIDMDIMSDAETEAWLKQSVTEYIDAKNGSPRLCTDEERWHSPGKWAVYKGGNVRATKLADTELELSAWIGTNQAKVGSNYRIEERPSSYKRCLQYCAAAPFCEQFKLNPGAIEEEA